MRKFVATILLAFSFLTVAEAQTFLDRLQKQAKGQGKITVTQDAAIDELVNGPKNVVTTPTAPKSTTTTTTKPKENTKKEHENTTKKNVVTVPTTPSTETETPSVDTRKKVMGKSYKVTGYRVQAFAGGNTRADKQKAQRIGNDIKMNYPDTPIYVHFYSPRWICRVGNYRTYEEAHKMLLEIRKMGYKQASIVKGKISVQY